MWRQTIVFVSAVVAVHWIGISSSRAAEQELATREPASREPAARAAASSDSDDEEYNFSWLDPDKKVYVLQNRKYRKKSRIAITLSAGLNLSNPYQSESLVAPRASYWISEQFGFEFFFAFLKNSDNGTLKALKDAGPAVLPFVRQNRSYYGGVLTWTPWYAKLNFFNKILYFDWFLYAGIGQVNTAVDHNRSFAAPSNFITETLFTVFYGTGQNFYVTQNWLVRLDLLGMAYNASGKDATTTTVTTNYDFSVGVGYLF